MPIVVRVTTIIDEVAALRRAAGLSAAGFARLAGMPTSTVTRIEAEERDPSISTLSALLTALGAELAISFRSDQAAIRAARAALDPTVPETPESSAWTTRWTRAGLLVGGRPADPAAFLEVIGATTRLSARRGSRTFDATSDPARTLAAAGIDYALTGSLAAVRLVEENSNPWPVVYVADLGAAEVNLTVAPGVSGAARTTILPFDGISETGRRRDMDGVWVADDRQVLIDCFGGPGLLPEQGRALLDAMIGVTR